MDGTREVFLLLAFTHLGHESQDFLSLYNGMHVCMFSVLAYTFSQKNLGNGVRTHVNYKGKIPSTRGGSNLQHCISPTHYRLSYFSHNWALFI